MKDQTSEDIAAVMRSLGEAARGAASALAVTSTDMKNAALMAGAAAIRAHGAEILTANAKDMGGSAGARPLGGPSRPA